MTVRVFKVSVEFSDMRVDRFIESMVKPDYSRNDVQRWISGGFVKCGKNLISRNAHKVSESEEYTVAIPDNFVTNKDASRLKGEPIPIEVIHENDDFLVVYKPEGMVVHPGAGISHGTLVNALVGAGYRLSDEGGESRPGIVHRLDKETSGLLLVAKNNRIHRALSDLFARRQVHKEYVAFVQGRVERLQDRISAPIGRHPSQREKMAVRFDENAKDALTDYAVEQQYTGGAALKVQLITGRTHQIRVHMSHIGHPIFGDTVYGGLKCSRLMLHSRAIEFDHPFSGEVMRFECRTPESFTLEAEKLSKRS